VPYVQRLVTRLGEDVIAQAVARYEAGESSVQIAKSLGVSKSGFVSLLKRRGVLIRQRRSLSHKEIVEAARLYESGLYLRQVAERFDVSTEQVRQALRRHGVVMRDDRGGRRGRR
jgi:DNA-binding CsgD family transcriptional regulator